MLIVGIAADRIGRLRVQSCVVASMVAAFFLTAGTTFSYSQGMALPGSAGVASGGAIYTIPIVVPPGTASMAPSLGLTYSSQSGNSSISGGGLVGAGWSIDGLPSITRCGRSVAQDGIFGTVSYDVNDRFCLDGQRLMVISGAYGADGAEYRTEIETFSKIVSHGTAGVGPAWFEVRTKTGQVMEFGNTTDSRILAQGKAVARSWAVNKVTDVKASYFTITYVNDNVNGQAYPSRIDYTGNPTTGLVPYNSVQFVYNTARPDVSPAYHQGSVIQTKVLLTNVRTYAGSTLVGDYRLTYQQGSATGRSQLTSVTLCDGAANCMPATTFAWQNGGTAPTTVISNVAGQDGQLAGYVPNIGDFNGDGIADIMWDSQANGEGVSSGTRVLWTGDHNGGFAVTSNFAGQNGTLSGYLPLIADFNRDGRTDVLWAQFSFGGLSGPTTRWNTSNTAAIAVTAGPSLPNGGRLISVAGLDADGRADLQVGTASTSGAFLTSYLTTSTGALTAVDSQIPAGSQPWCAANAVTGADFDGDGRLDILLLKMNTSGFGGSVCGKDAADTSGTYGVFFGNGDGTFRSVAPADASVSGYVPVYGDFNGDGKTDILWTTVDSDGRSNGNRIVWLSKGDGSFVVITNPGGTNGSLTGYIPYPGDFNGDGKTDILWVAADTNGFATGLRVGWQAKGDGTFLSSANFAGQDGQLSYYPGTCSGFGCSGPIPASGFVPLVADFNGDGKTDVLWDKRTADDNRSQGVRVLWLSDSVPYTDTVIPDLMTGVTTGLGATTTFIYRPLTSPNYTKENTATDPIVDFQGAMQIVARIDTSDGVGGIRNLRYTYAGAKADQNGRGFLGFRVVTANDWQTNLLQTTTYRQDYPYAGMVASDVQSLNGAALSTTTNSFSATNLGGTRYQVFMTQSQVASNDLDGTPLPTATSAYQFDAFGNATQIVVSHSDGYSKTTTNTYTNDTTRWLLGRLTRASVASQAPP